MRKISHRVAAVDIGREISRAAIESVKESGLLDGARFSVVLEVEGGDGGREVVFKFKSPQEIDFKFSPIQIICNGHGVKDGLVKIIREIIKRERSKI